MKILLCVLYSIVTALNGMGLHDDKHHNLSGGNEEDHKEKLYLGLPVTLL
jgi:hypothetical protein